MLRFPLTGEDDAEPRAGSNIHPGKVATERPKSDTILNVETAIVLVLGESAGTPLLRIHSECITGGLQIASLRLRRPAGSRDADHRRRGMWFVDLSVSGGARHRIDG